jgi:hypothetical protein
VLDYDRADGDEFLHGPVDGVGGALVKAPRQRGTGGHPRAGGVPVAKEDGVQAHGGIADLSVEQPLGDDGEAILHEEVCRLDTHATTPADLRATS